MLQCVAMCCSVSQYVAVCCSMLQYAAVCCSMLQCVAMCCSVLQCAAVCCSVLQCVAVCCNVVESRGWTKVNFRHPILSNHVLQRVAVCCNVLQTCRLGEVGGCLYTARMYFHVLRRRRGGWGCSWGGANSQGCERACAVENEKRRMEWRGEYECVVVCCSVDVLQCVAVLMCSNVLQCVAVCDGVERRV